MKPRQTKLKKNVYKIWINDNDLKENLLDLNVDFLDSPSKEALAIVMRFLSPDGKKNYDDVKNVLYQIEQFDVPAIILDDKLIPEHSKQVWLHKNTVRYLPLDDPETTWTEVIQYLSQRIDQQDKTNALGSAELFPVGWSVNISPEDFGKYNLVSLFIGSMGDFLVELKHLLEIIRPSELEDYPLIDADIPRILEFKWAIRNNMEDHEYLGEIFTKEAMKETLQNANAGEFFERSAPSLTRNHIIIEGETGTGKSIIADFIHSYVYKPFVNCGALKIVNCANLGEKIAETQLFGSIKGAYTDAITRPGAIIEAYNGTVFLDEIGELTLELQARLLYYLESQTIHPIGWSGKGIFVPSLIVAATNRNLQEEVDRGRFRRDLWHRLGFTVTIPPLRDRIGDLERLMDFVLQNPGINPRIKNGDSAVEYIEIKAIDLLKNFEFRGNFRELEQIMRRAVIMSKSLGVKVIMADILTEIISKMRS